MNFYGNCVAISNISLGLETVCGTDQNQASIRPGDRLNWVRTQHERLNSPFESSSDVLTHNHVRLATGPAGATSVKIL